MRKLVILLIFGAVVSPLFAQTVSEENSSKFYYHNVSVEKVYPTRRGYIVVYYRGFEGFGTVGIPNEWFTAAASKAELVTLPPGKNWPTMTLFYKDGEFTHVRLYVHKNKRHQTWGNVPLPADVSIYFDGSDTLNIKF